MSKDVGRNDPCYCGSGKKYKKCCLALEDHKREVNIAYEAHLHMRHLLGEKWAALFLEVTDSKDIASFREFLWKCPILSQADFDRLMANPDGRDYFENRFESACCMAYRPEDNGKTPRQAVKTKSGRAKVETLLDEFENNSLRQPANEVMRFLDVGKIRYSLGIEN